MTIIGVHVIKSQLKWKWELIITQIKTLLRVFSFHEILKVSYILCFLIKGTRNERKVLATSPRSDLREYKSGMAATSKTSTKRPCEDEAGVKINTLNRYTYQWISQTFQNVQLQEITQVCCLSSCIPFIYISVFSLLLTGSTNCCQLIKQTLLFR